MNNLECSSKGDKRFSAFYAFVDVNFKYDSIESHYQTCKRDVNGNIPGKGRKVSYIVINGFKLGPEYLTPYYKLLWVKYLDKNPDLVEYAKGFNTFTDMFRGKCINCQADVIKQYVKEGRHSIMKSADVVDLINKIK